MENWGLVIYKEAYLLLNETTHTSSSKLNIVRLIAHEFSHQNFGNLVSNQWWSYVWLKEGFATLFEVIGVDLVSDLASRAYGLISMSRLFSITFATVM